MNSWRFFAIIFLQFHFCHGDALINRAPHALYYGMNIMYASASVCVYMFGSGGKNWLTR